MEVTSLFALYEHFRQEAQARGACRAVMAPEGELDFAGLFAEADRLADVFSAQGVHEHTVVGFSLPNTLSFVPTFLALAKLSVTVALISPKYQQAELQAIVDGLAPSFFVTTSSHADGVQEAVLVKERVAINNSAAIPEVTLLSLPRAEQSHALTGGGIIKLSSGTTGVPKAIGLTPANILAEANTIADTLGVRSNDIILAPVPVFHSYGFDLGVLSMLVSGARLILRDSFVPRMILRDMAGSRATIFLGVPSMYRFLVDTHLAQIPDLSRIRYMLSCTAPLPVALIEAFRERFGVALCQHYGSSETGAVAVHDPSAVADRAGSVGRAMQGVSVRVVDSDGSDVPAGKSGEVLVESDAVSSGYIMGGPDGASPLHDGSYRTGDRGRLDADGYLFLEGRLDRQINVGGLKVSPEEVTNVLLECDGVSDAAVIGVEDSGGEEVVWAMVAGTVEIDEADLIAFCRSRLADYKVPRRIAIRRALPVGPTGKVRVTRGDF